MEIKNITLSNGILHPSLGLGTWQLTNNHCVQAVEMALGIGYRHIDTADIYDNQPEVADGIARSKINRKDLFITSKIWRTDLGKEKISKALHKILGELRTDYLDQLLIHWPNKEIPIEETLEMMQKFLDDGVVRSIGVSNFAIHHLKKVKDSGIIVHVNQVELHPSLKQPKLQQYCVEENITIVAYSPLGRGEDLTIPLIKDLSLKYEKQPNQIILNWLHHKNMIVIPKATTYQHLLSNFESLNFSITQDDITKIDALAEGDRLINPQFSEFEEQ